MRSVRLLPVDVSGTTLSAATVASSTEARKEEKEKPRATSLVGRLGEKAVVCGDEDAANSKRTDERTRIVLASCVILLRPIANYSSSITVVYFTRDCVK